MGLRSIVDGIISFALPPRCASCGTIVDADHKLCLTCWQNLTFLTGDGCSTCNRPMEIAGLQCAPCMADPPKHDGVRAVVAYGDVARTIILKLKHGRRPGIAKSIAALATPQLRELEGAILAPVPLHRRRLWSRGFNQSLLIAQRLNLPPDAVLLPDLLIRTKATPMMRGLSRRDRAKNVAGAFKVNGRHKGALSGRTVCIVDDVYTSGATINACAAILKRAGAERVIALCWARVLQEEAAY